MKTEKRKIENVLSDPENTRRMSPYAKFHFKYLGYNFKNILTGRIYTKGEFWDCFKEKALANSKKEGKGIPTTPDGFELVKYKSINFDKWQDLIDSKRNR